MCKGFFCSGDVLKCSQQGKRYLGATLRQSHNEYCLPADKRLELWKTNIVCLTLRNSFQMCILADCTSRGNDTDTPCVVTLRKLSGHNVLGGVAAPARLRGEPKSNFNQPDTPLSLHQHHAVSISGPSLRPDRPHQERHRADRAASLIACCCYGNSVFQKPPVWVSIQWAVSHGDSVLSERHSDMMSTCARMTLPNILLTIIFGTN